MPAQEVKKLNDKVYKSYVKCKRTKTLIKKSLEVSIQCDVDIIIIVYDKTKK